MKNKINYITFSHAGKNFPTEYGNIKENNTGEFQIPFSVEIPASEITDGTVNVALSEQYKLLYRDIKLDKKGLDTTTAFCPFDDESDFDFEINYKFVKNKNVDYEGANSDGSPKFVVQGNSNPVIIKGSIVKKLII